MRSIVPTALLCVALSCGALMLLIAPGAGAGEQSGNPQVVKIHADWCGTCTKLNPTWDALREEYGDSVDFVVLDVTDREAKSASEATAKQRGLEQIFKTYGGRTGTILIVAPGGDEPVAVLAGETDVAAYDEPIAEARSS
jgi:thiol-disulfide isomerase/thioredoxin